MYCCVFVAKQYCSSFCCLLFTQCLTTKSWCPPPCAASWLRACRFGTLQSDIAAAVSATRPGSPSFMLKSGLQPLADLANLTLDNTELELAHHFFTDNKYSDAKAIAQSSVISSMPSVQRIVQLSRTIAVSMAAWESSFSTLKWVLTPHHMSMLHSRKADLILISYERELAGKLQSD